MYFYNSQIARFFLKSLFNSKQKYVVTRLLTFLLLISNLMKAVLVALLFLSSQAIAGDTPT